MNIKQTLGDKVLLKIETSTYKSKGGIYDPLAGKRKMPIGKVKSIGEKVKRRDILNEHVYFDLYEGWRIDDFHIIIEEEHIYMLILKEEKDG